MVQNSCLQDKPLESRQWACRGEVETACNLCGNSSSVWLVEENGLSIVRCPECELIYVNPRPHASELEKFYAQYLTPDVSDLWEKATQNLFIKDISRITEYRSSGTILDIGCGFGFFLSLMQGRGWVVEGCDLSPVAAKHAREKLGMDHVTCGQFQSLNYPENHFDVMTLWYVLHHLPDPKKVLQKAHKLLKRDGIIAVRVPNMDLFKALWWLKKHDCRMLRRMLKIIRRQTANQCAPYNVLDPPVHLFAFNPRVLKKMLERVGFTVISTYNDGMVSRGNLLNRIIDQSITLGADLIKHISQERLDLSISFSVYARKS